MNNLLNPNWIRGSIFYNKKSWGKLISEAIIPFLESETASINLYYLHFRREPIDNIRLTIQLNHKTINVEEHFLSYMDEYLLVKPSDTYIKQYKFYPNNTAWTNQFDERSFYTKWEFRNDLSKIRHQISKCMSIFAYQEIDEESLFTFVIYMQMAVIKALCNDIEQAPHTAQAIVSYLNSNNYLETFGKDGHLLLSLDRLSNLVSYQTLLFKQKDGEKAFKAISKSNEPMLLEIVEDVWNSDLNDMPWLKEWIATCVTAYNGAEFEKFFIITSRLIYEHVGLTTKNLIYISSKLITHSLQQKLSS